MENKTNITNNKQKYSINCIDLFPKMEKNKVYTVEEFCKIITEKEPPKRVETFRRNLGYCSHIDTGIEHYGCSCNCRLCRKKETYRYHLVCFECRESYKSNSVSKIRERKCDPNDKIFETYNINHDKYSKNPVRLNIELSGYINKYCEYVKCRTCHNPIFVGGFDLRCPPKKNIKEWKKLKNFLTSEDTYKKTEKTIFMSMCNRK